MINGEWKKSLFSYNNLTTDPNISETNFLFSLVLDNIYSIEFDFLVLVFATII